MTAGSVAERWALRGLELVRAAVRTLPAERRSGLTRRCRPAFDRTMSAVARPDLRDEERRLRAAIDAEPGNGRLWLQLGRLCAARARHRKATDAFVTAAERGASLSTVTIALLNRPPIHRIAGAERIVERMHRIAEDDPESVEKQLLIGAFMLDQGRLDAGRALIRRAYEAQLAPLSESDSLDSLGSAHRRTVTGPDFMILGPPKTGSTSLYSFLVEHPRVVTPPRKELQFWRFRYGRSLDVHDAYFPGQLPSLCVTGEASTNTLTTPGAAEEIARRYPAVKVIVLRRDPVARAYSEYQMWRRDTSENREFDAVTAFQLRRIGDVPPLEPADVAHLPPDYYLLKSCILPYLRRWSDALGAASVMVVESAALASHRQCTVDAVHDFLCLPRRPISDPEDRNVYEYDPIPEATAARLAEWFAPHEAALDEFLSTHPNVIRAPGG